MLWSSAYEVLLVSWVSGDSSTCGGHVEFFSSWFWVYDTTNHEVWIVISIVWDMRVSIR